MFPDSPLLELQRARGGRIAERDHRLVPVHFGDPLREHEAVQNRVGLLDLSSRSFLRFTGGDRVTFLNGMVSNDVRTLAPGQGLHAAFLDIQGKILADARIFCTAEALLVDVPEACKDILLRHLERHLVADEVDIEDLSSRWTLLSLQGPRAGTLLREAGPIDDLPSSELAHASAAIGGFAGLIVRVTHICAEGYDLVYARADAPRLAEHLSAAGERFGLSWVGADAQEMLRLEAGIPRYGLDMSADTLLLETGLDYAVSFNKGCYLGQEVVERIHSRGHVNRRLILLSLETAEPAARGAGIGAGARQIGTVTSSAFSPRRGTALALGYVQKSCAEPGTRVAIQKDGTEIPATVVSGAAPASS